LHIQTKENKAVFRSRNLVNRVFSSVFSHMKLFLQQYEWWKKYNSPNINFVVWFLYIFFSFVFHSLRKKKRKEKHVPAAVSIFWLFSNAEITSYDHITPFICCCSIKIYFNTSKKHP
jgi:hypothetical protein